MHLSFNNLMIMIVCAVGIYTTTLFYIFFFENKKKIKDPKPPKILPSVAICVPFYNEKEATIKTVESLVNLDYPKNKLTIYVVDDGSTDDSYNLIKNYLNKHNFKNILLYKKKNGGKYTALNYALSKTNSEIFGVLDADSVVDKKALKNMIGYFKEKDVVAVTPSMKVWPKGNFWQRVQQIEFFLGIWLRKVFSYMDSLHVTPGPFSLFKRDFFKKHGNYREAHMTEDIEMALRIQSHNYKIKNSLNAHVYTEGPKTIKSLNKQRLRWYAGFIKNTLDYKHLFGKKYGNLGVVFLPLAYLSVFLVLGTLLYQLIKLIFNSIDKLRWVILSNFDIFRWDFNFDIFYVNAGPIILLSIISTILMLIMVYHAYLLSKKKETSIFVSVICFMVLYYFLYAYWWINSIISVIRNKKLTWNHKSDLNKKLNNDVR